MSAGSESPVVGPGAAGGDSGKGKDTEGSTSVPQTSDAGLWEVFWSRISVRAPRIALIVGLLLTGLGLLAFFAFAEIQHAPAFTAAQADAAPGTVEDRSVTTLIPAFWGLPIVVCAVATLSADKITGVKEDTRTKVRKHAMHVVAILALLGVLASLGQIIAKGAIAIAKNGCSKITRHGCSVGPGWWSVAGTQITMCLLCAGLLKVTVTNFIDIRRARSAAEEETRAQDEEK